MTNALLFACLYIKLFWTYRIMIYDTGELGVYINCTEYVDSVYTLNVIVSLCGEYYHVSA